MIKTRQQHLKTQHLHFVKLLTLWCVIICLYVCKSGVYRCMNSVVLTESTWFFTSLMPFAATWRDKPRGPCSCCGCSCTVFPLKNPNTDLDIWAILPSPIPRDNSVHANFEWNNKLNIKRRGVGRSHCHNLHYLFSCASPVLFLKSSSVVL